MNKPIVSVIIPTYNSATTLEACLRSINAQTYKNHLVSLRSLEAFEAQLQNIEIIVVDKFSADEMRDIESNRYSVKETNDWVSHLALPAARNKMRYAYMFIRIR